MENIQANSFSGCTGLTVIDNLPHSIKDLGAFAFSGCTGLERIDLSSLANLDTLGDRTFEDCTGLTDINKLPPDIKSIGHSVFEGCTSLKSVDLSTCTRLNTVGPSAFENCTGLTDIILPASITSFGSEVFLGCTNLNSINISDLTNLQSIDLGVFENCTALRSIDNLPDSLTSIDQNAFRGCTGLRGIENLPDSLIEIGESAFRDCTGLEVIIIPEGVTKIYKNAFKDCSNLKTVIFLGKDAPTFSSDIFQNISPIPTVYAPDGATGYDDLNPQITPAMTPPVITRDPESVTAKGGSTAVFTTQAAGFPPPHFQWQVNTGSGWTDVSDGTGGNSTQYTTPATNANMNGWQYRCFITNSEDSVTSDAATLTVAPDTDTNSNTDSDSGFASSSTSVLNGNWMRSETGEWRFLLTTGQYAANRWGFINGRWYYFNGEGRMLTNWQQLNGEWYYLTTLEETKQTDGIKEGEMRTGWLYDPFYQKWFYLDSSGAMVTGWKKIDGKWYYFNPVSDGARGTMAADSEIDGHRIGSDGAML